MKQNWVNTGGIGVVITMLFWGGNKGFEKMDMLNTTSIETKMRVAGLEVRVAEVSNQVALMVTRDQLKSELDKRDKTIEELKRELTGIKQHSIRP